VQVREGEVPPLPDDSEPASAVPHLRSLSLWELSECMLQVSWNIVSRISKLLLNKKLKASP
jgi:hypothetical protein